MHGIKKEVLISNLKERSRHLYLNRRLLCTEAVMVSMNQGLRGGLSEAQAVAMAAPFCVALGESGCLCGALSGAIMACGLFLGDGGSSRQRRVSRECAHQLHDMFKDAYGATCCRLLSLNVKNDEKAHFMQCAELTANATEMAANLILRKRPELLMSHSATFFQRSNSKVINAVNRIFRYFNKFH